MGTAAWRRAAGCGGTASGNGAGTCTKSSAAFGGLAGSGSRSETAPSKTARTRAVDTLAGPGDGQDRCEPRMPAVHRVTNTPCPRRGPRGREPRCGAGHGLRWRRRQAVLSRRRRPRRRPLRRRPGPMRGASCGTRLPGERQAEWAETPRIRHPGLNSASRGCCPGTCGIHRVTNTRKPCPRRGQALSGRLSTRWRGRPSRAQGPLLMSGFDVGLEQHDRAVAHLTSVVEAIVGGAEVDAARASGAGGAGQDPRRARRQ